MAHALAFDPLVARPPLPNRQVLSDKAETAALPFANALADRMRAPQAHERANVPAAEATDTVATLPETSPSAASAAVTALPIQADAASQYASVMSASAQAAPLLLDVGFTAVANLHRLRADPLEATTLAETHAAAMATAGTALRALGASDFWAGAPALSLPESASSAASGVSATASGALGLALGHALAHANGRWAAEHGHPLALAAAEMQTASSPAASTEAPHPARGRTLPAMAAEFAAAFPVRRAVMDGAFSVNVSSSAVADARLTLARSSLESSVSMYEANASQSDAIGALTLAPPSASLPAERDPVFATQLFLSRSAHLEAPPSRPILPFAAPLASAQWTGELAEKLVWLISRQGHVAELQLNPPALGSLEVRLSLHGHEAAAQFYSANAAVREALEAALPRLREMLASAGISLGGASVSDESFQSATSSPQDGRSDNGERRSQTAFSEHAPPAVPRTLLGLIDLYA